MERKDGNIKTIKDKESFFELVQSHNKYMSGEWNNDGIYECLAFITKTKIDEEVKLQDIYFEQKAKIFSNHLSQESINLRPFNFGIFLEAIEELKKISLVKS